MQADVLRLIDDLVRDNGMGLILMQSTTAAGGALLRTKILVMNAGPRRGKLRGKQNLHMASHPYTKGLLARRAEDEREPALSCRSWTEARGPARDRNFLEQCRYRL